MKGKLRLYGAFILFHRPVSLESPAIVLRAYMHKFSVCVRLVHAFSLVEMRRASIALYGVILTPCRNVRPVPCAKVCLTVWVLMACLKYPLALLRYFSRNELVSESLCL